MYLLQKWWQRPQIWTSYSLNNLAEGHESWFWFLPRLPRFWGIFLFFFMKIGTKWPKSGQSRQKSKIWIRDPVPNTAMGALVQIWGLYYHFCRKYIFSKIPENTVITFQCPWSNPYVFENSKLNILTTKYFLIL